MPSPVKLSTAVSNHIGHMSKKATIIVAATPSWGIGVSSTNSLPWKLPSELRWFAAITTGNEVIMGRKGWESIPAKFKPLKNRRNVVLSRQLDYVVPNNVSLKHSIQDAMADANKTGTTFIIGGAEIYREALDLNLVDRLLITRIANEYEQCDVFFPDFSSDKWLLKDDSDLQKWAGEVKVPQGVQEGGTSWKVEMWEKV